MGFSELFREFFVGEFLALREDFVNIFHEEAIDESEIIFCNLISYDLLPDKSRNVDVKKNS